MIIASGILVPVPEVDSLSVLLSTTYTIKMNGPACFVPGAIESHNPFQTTCLLHGDYKQCPS